MTKTEKNYLESIRLLGGQLKQAFKEAGKLKLPKAYGSVSKVVVCGMGGSQLGADLVGSLFSKEVKLPVIQVRDYNLPGFVDSKTLTFLVSYSGATEEVLEAGRKAKQAKAKMVVIASGSKLAALAKRNNWPLYKFEPINNPSGQPRMGIGYIAGGLLAVLKKLGKATISINQINQLNSSVAANFEKYTRKAFANQLARKLIGKIPIIVSAEHLLGNAHIMANQFHESAKQIALYFPLPELNHHLLEGLTFPKVNRQNLYFLFFYSADYHPRNQKRFKITQEVLAKQKIKYQHLEFAGDKLEQSSEMLVLGSLLSYYLAKINRVDPNRVPWVNYLKRRLK